MRNCGRCNLCCKILGVVDLPKPKDQWCNHCDKGMGCRIYHSRPKTCREFDCVWLQDSDGKILGDDCRPDRIGVVLQMTENGIIAHCDVARHAAWRDQKIRNRLRILTLAGNRIVVRSGKRHWELTPLGEWEAP